MRGARFQRDLTITKRYDRGSPVISVRGEQATYSDVFADQMLAFMKSRGFDRVASAPGTVPRTTGADVAKLADYWNAAINNPPSPRPGDLGGINRARAVWIPEMALALAAGQSSPGGVYARNADFWHAMMTVSTELAVLKEAPTKWDLAKAAVVESAENVAKKIGGGALEIGKYVAIAAAVVGSAVLAGELVAASMGHKK